MRSQGLLGFSCCIMLMCHKAVWRCECEEVSGAGDQAMSTITITFYPAPDQSRDLIKLARGVHRNPSRVSASDNKQTRGKQPVIQIKCELLWLWLSLMPLSWVKRFLDKSTAVMGAPPLFTVMGAPPLFTLPLPGVAPPPASQDKFQTRTLNSEIKKRLNWRNCTTEIDALVMRFTGLTH